MAILLGGISLLIHGSFTIDIQLYDTYYVIAFSHFTVGFLLLQIFSALLYAIINWLGIKTVLLLNWLHFLLTFQLLIIVLYLFSPITGITGSSRRYYSFNSVDGIRDYQRTLAYEVHSFSAFLFGQICLLLNLAISFSARFIQKFKNKN